MRGVPKFLLDLNVVLDYMAQRQPWYAAASAIFQAEARAQASLFVSGAGVSTLAYILQEGRTRQKARVAVEIMLRRLRVATVDQAVVDLAFKLNLPDFEDAIQAAAAIEAGIPILVTRDAGHFKGLGDRLQVLAPEVAAAALGWNAKKD